MRKRAKIAFAVLLFAILAGTIVAILHRPEPVYRGQTLSYWLQQYNELGDVVRVGPADDAIRAFGTNSLPYLLSDLQRSESATERMISRFCSRHPWYKLPFYCEDHYSGPALMAFKTLRSEASPILPELANLLENNRTTEKAAQAFFLVGPASIPTLEEVCRHTNVAIRVQAAVLIAVIESNEIGYSYGWHNSPVNGKPVLLWGWGYGARAERTISRLAEGLHSRDPAIQLANLDALRSIASSASNALPSSIVTWVEVPTKMLMPHEKPSSKPTPKPLPEWGCNKLAGKLTPERKIPDRLILEIHL